jgi:SpoVK/Ycf46/Vps4 family AAA+-type ATPase
MWARAAERTGAALDDRALDALASTFRLTSHQIDRASDAASARAWWRGSTDAPEIGDWLAGARAQGGDELASLATRVPRAHEWSDLVLPEDALAQLREIRQRISSKRTVMDTWGFDRRMTRGRGVNALFSGPSGTGKTMAAEILAHELGLDLFRIELAEVVSKYIGETEKNLDRIFLAAEQANGILLFDEADALFGKRSEVRDSHDRYANLEISYLLQKMEQFDGIAILATNLRANLDEAFIRRLAFTIHFPFPDFESRRRIWSSIWPSETPLSPEIDFDFLSRQFALSGGNIRNIALGAAFFAAEGGGAVTMRDLMRATFREYQKLGKTLDVMELGAYASELA